jgi:alkylation response protein AidB-like acyl-CoA dehydrogenase
MLLNLTEDQEFFRETTERFLTEQVPPDAVRALRHDATGFDPTYWRRGAELGWTSLLVGEEHGGGTISGAGLVDLALVAYAFGRHAAPGPLATTNVVAATLAVHGTQGTQSDVLASILSGEGVATWCPPSVGPAGWRPTVEAIHDGPDLVLRGEARPVESAGAAAHLLVTCRDGDGGDGETGTETKTGTETGTTQVLVPTSAAGVTVSPLQTVDLSRRFSVVTFDDVRVPADALVGAAHQAGPDVDGQLQLYLVVLNAESVGAMQSGFDMTVEWAFDRYSFGRPLASYQALKHRFADMMSWLEASHAISAASCAATQDRTAEAPELVSAAKAYIGQYGAELLQECVQLHGGIGVTFEHDLHLYLRRVIVDRALGGTPADHRQHIALIVAEREREREQEEVAA